LWQVALKAGAHATPMTYLGRDGKQYVLVAAGGQPGFGTGMDIRPNPGIGFPGYADYLPVTAHSGNCNGTMLIRSVRVWK